MLGGDEITKRIDQHIRCNMSKGELQCEFTLYCDNSDGEEMFGGITFVVEAQRKLPRKVKKDLKNTFGRYAYGIWLEAQKGDYHTTNFGKKVSIYFKTK